MDSVWSVLIEECLKAGHHFFPPYYFSREAIAAWMGVDTDTLNRKLREIGVRGKPGMKGQLLDARRIGPLLFGGADDAEAG